MVGYICIQTSVPAKSSQSGVVLIVVPGVLGLMCWSPGLDCNGNSWRGVHFCEVRYWINVQHLYVVSLFSEILPEKVLKCLSCVNVKHLLYNNASPPNTPLSSPLRI